MRCFSLILTLLLFACIPPMNSSGPTVSDVISPDPICADVICPEGYVCQTVAGTAICARSAAQVGLCDLDCGPGAQCRHGECFDSDPEGSVCEFDDQCGHGLFCVTGRCTQLSCFPGETMPCYGGPVGTAGIGECTIGYYLCDHEGIFDTEACINEMVPRDEIGLLLCNGLDDNCDGQTDSGTTKNVDIVFAFDISTSMSDNFLATTTAIFETAAMYDTSEVRLGFVVFPNPFALVGTDAVIPNTLVPLSSYADFSRQMGLISAGLRADGASEASYDVIRRLGLGLQDGIVWGEDSRRVVILFTDEEAQSYEDIDGDGECAYEIEGAYSWYTQFCDVSEVEAAQAAAQGELVVYVFVNPDIMRREADEDGVITEYPIEEDFDSFARVFDLSEDPNIMIENLTDIVDYICDET